MTNDVEFVDVDGTAVAEFENYNQPIPRQGELVAFERDHFEVIDVKYRPEFYHTVVYLESTDRKEGRE